MNASDLLSRILPVIQNLGTLAATLPVPPQIKVGIVLLTEAAALGQQMIDGNDPTPEQWAALDAKFDADEAKFDAAIAASRKGG